MISLKTNGNKILVPGCYEELTTGRFQKAVTWDSSPPPDKRDYLQLFCLLSGTDFKSSDLTTSQQVTLENTIRWYFEQPYEFSKELPKAIKFKGKILMLPRDLGDLGIGQNIFLHQRIVQTKFLEENIAVAAATIIQPLYDNAKFNSDRVKELEKEILEMPITVIYPIGFFLLSRLLPSGSGPWRVWLQILINLKQRLKRMWQGWRRSIGSVVTMSFQ